MFIPYKKQGDNLEERLRFEVVNKVCLHIV